MNVESKTKSTQEHRWGVMPPQDMPGQLTRSMVEMRKPKAYEVWSWDKPSVAVSEWWYLFQLKELPSLPTHAMKYEDVEELCITPCPLVLHSIQLMTYIKQVDITYSPIQFINLASINILRWGDYRSLVCLVSGARLNGTLPGCQFECYFTCRSWP